MALVSCPECDGKVSGEAKTCPHCGFAVAKARKKAENEAREARLAEAREHSPNLPSGKAMLIGILGLAAFFAAGFLIYKVANREPPTEDVDPIEARRSFVNDLNTRGTNHSLRGSFEARGDRGAEFYLDSAVCTPRGSEELMARFAKKAKGLGFQYFSCRQYSFSPGDDFP